MRASAGRPSRRVSAACHLRAHRDPVKAVQASYLRERQAPESGRASTAGRPGKRQASRKGRVCRFRQTRPPSSTPGPTKRRAFRATSARPGATSIVASAAPTPSVTQSSSTPQDTARKAPLHSRAPARALLRERRRAEDFDNGGAKWNTATGIQGREIRQVAFDPRNLSRVYAVRSSPAACSQASIGARHGRTTGSNQTSSMCGPSQSTVPVQTSSTPAPTATDSSGTDYGETWMALASGGRRRSFKASPSTRGQPASIRCETERVIGPRSRGPWTQVLTSASWGITIDEVSLDRLHHHQDQRRFRSFDGGHTFAASSVGLGSLTMGRAAKVTIDPRDTGDALGSEAHGGGAATRADRGDRGPQLTRASRASRCSRSRSIRTNLRSFT